MVRVIFWLLNSLVNCFQNSWKDKLILKLLYHTYQSLWDLSTDISLIKVFKFSIIIITSLQSDEGDKFKAV